MKALTFDPIIEQFVLAELAVPTVGANDLLIKVEACGLNPVDAKIRLWRSMVPQMDSNWVPGLDVAGTIVATGSGVTQWQVGECVLCHGDMFRPHGGLAEYSIQDADAVIPHPDLPADVAAATPCAGWTAWRALNDKLRLQQRNSILVVGGSGGVGSFAIQIAAYFGVEQIIATSSLANLEFVKGLGATDVIDYVNEDVLQRVSALTEGRGVEAGLDAVGGDNDILVADALGYEGEMVGLVQDLRPSAYRQAFMKGLSFHQLSLGSGHRNGHRAKSQLVESGRAFSCLLEQGVIRVAQLETLSLEQASNALNRMLAQRTVGKLVVAF